MDYSFPEAIHRHLRWLFNGKDSGEQQNMKILEMARLWKKRKLEGSQ